MKFTYAWLALLVLWIALSGESHAMGIREKPLTADEYCMAVNIYYEARFEPNEGLYAVGYVTANRARHRHQSVCHVVFAYKQFSWVLALHALDEAGHLKQEFRPRSRDPYWVACRVVARDVLSHPDNDFTHGAEYFVANYIYPHCLTRACNWSRNLVYVGQYGVHLFFASQAEYTRFSVVKSFKAMLHRSSTINVIHSEYVVRLIGGNNVQKVRLYSARWHYRRYHLWSAHSDSRFCDLQLTS